MKGDPVLPGDHVARHCRYTDIMWQSGQSAGITEAAFRPRDSENDGLSVNWAEFFLGNNLQHHLACIRSVTKLQVKSSHRIALLLVQYLIKAGLPISALTVIHDPDEGLPPAANAAHALIRPIADLNNVMVRQKLAALVKPGDLHRYQ